MAECKLNYSADDINRRLGLLDFAIRGDGGGNAIWSYNMSEITTNTNILGNPILQITSEIGSLVHPTQGECPVLVYQFELSNCQGTSANSKQDCISPSFESYQFGSGYYCYEPYHTFMDVGFGMDEDKIFIINYLKNYLLDFDGDVLDIFRLVDGGSRSSAGDKWVAKIRFYVIIYCATEEIATGLQSDLNELFAESEKFYIMRNNYQIVEGLVR